MPVLGDDDQVLDADAELSRHVDAGLDGDDLAGGEGVLGGAARALGFSWISRPTPWPRPWPK